MIIKGILLSAITLATLVSPSRAQVTSFNSRTGAVTLQSSDVTGVLLNQSLSRGTGTLTAAGVTNTGNETIAGTLGVTGIATVSSIASTSSTAQILLKNGPYGPFMLEIGGSSKDIEPQTNIQLPGGVWNAVGGALANNLAPIYQNTVFSGNVTTSASAFGLFLQQSDNSAYKVNLPLNEQLPVVGIYEGLTLNGSLVTGSL